MRTVTTATVLALSLALSACAAGPTEEEFTRNDAEAVRKTASELSAAFNQKSIDKVLDLYAENSVFMPPNAPLLRGRDPLKSFYTDLSGKWTELEMEPNDVAGHGPLAYQSGTYTLTSADARDRGKYLIVLRNMGGSWKIEHSAWNSDLPKVAGN
jgi:ketosteroid isomerase-like protein